MDDEELTPEQKRTIAEFGETGGMNRPEEALGTGEVEKMLIELVVNTDLTMKQANDVLNLIGEGGGVYEAAGYVAGEFNISPKEIERATDGGISAGKVEEQKRNLLRTAGDVVGSVDRFTDPIGDALVGGIRGVTGVRGFGTGEAFFSDESGISGAIIDTKAEAREKRARAEIRDDVRDVIDMLHDAGELTDGQATQMKSVTDNYNRATYQDLLTEIEGKLGDFKYTSEGQMRFISDTLGDLRSRTVDLTDGAAGSTDGEAEPVPEAEVAADGVTDVASIGSFADLIEQAGIMGSKMGLPEAPEKVGQDYIYVDGTKVAIPKIGPGPGGVYDPLFVRDVDIFGTGTGSVLSNSQKDAILASQALKTRYAELGKQAGYSAKITSLIESDVFKPRNQGGRGLPIENLDGWIPTLVPTESWQRPLYDWDKGSGVAQWQGMAAYSRRAKVDYMVDNGLIMEDERYQYEDMYSLAAGEMWETVNSVSRNGQMSQYEAMKQLGSYATGIREQFNVTGGGGGRVAPKYSVPASLRVIPDYKALAMETKGLFQSQLGRDLEDNELAFLSDELGSQYKTRNDQLITANKAAWDAGVSGGTVDVSDIEVTDPASALQFDIEERYADELGRQEDVEEYGASRQLLIDSIAVGQRMI